MEKIDMAGVQKTLEQSIVKVVCEQNDKADPVIVLTGIPIVSESNFCYIIVPKECLCATKVTRKKIVFPDVDKTSVRVTAKNTKVHGDLASIAVQVSSKLVQAVKIITQKVKDDEPVYMIGFSPPESLGSHFDSGFVTAQENQHCKGYFNHDCPPYINTANGEPVFNSKHELVGINCKDRGVTCAMDVDTITEGISNFFEGMENKNLQEIIEFIKQKKTECWRKQKKDGGSKTTIKRKKPDEGSQRRVSSRIKRKKD